MKGKGLESKLQDEMTELEKRELKLFHSYNRHAIPEVKLRVLRELQDVIVKLDYLKNLQN